MGPVALTLHSQFNGVLSAIAVHSPKNKAKMCAGIFGDNRGSLETGGGGKGLRGCQTYQGVSLRVTVYSVKLHCAVYVLGNKDVLS
jgi:hypothetical protein